MKARKSAHAHAAFRSFVLVQDNPRTPGSCLCLFGAREAQRTAPLSGAQHQIVWSTHRSNNVRRFRALFETFSAYSSLFKKIKKTRRIFLFRDEHRVDRRPSLGGTRWTLGRFHVIDSVKSTFSTGRVRGGMSQQCTSLECHVETARALRYLAFHIQQASHGFESLR